MAKAGKIIIAADFGTSGVKLAALSRGLKLIAGRTAAYPTRHPGRGRVEQAPADWWRALRRGLKVLEGDVPGLKQRAAALVFTAQMNGLVAADESGKPLRPALIWLDKRASAEARRLAGGAPAVKGYNIVKAVRWLHLANGVPSLTGTDLTPRTLWLRKHEPEIWARTRILLDCKDWLVLKATGRRVTTPDCANLTWMMDTRAGRHGWSEPLLKALDLAPGLLPEIIDGAERAGGLSAQAARDLGLAEGLPVAGGCGDLTAAALGSGATGDGALHLYLGTSNWIGGFFPSRRLNPFHFFSTILSGAGARPLLIAAQELSGGAISWGAAALGFKARPGALHVLIDEALAGGDAAAGPLFLPWLAGERVPVDDAGLRGAFLGLALGHGRDDMLRAVIEGVALNIAWGHRAVARTSGVDRAQPLRLIGGIAHSSAFCQLTADCLGREVAVAADPHLAGVRGAGLIAAAMLGWIDSAGGAEAQQAQAEARIIAPDAARHEVFKRRLSAYRAAHRRLAPWHARFAGQDTP